MDAAGIAGWAEDYDIFDPDYVKDPVPFWEHVREGECPIAHSEQRGPSWLPTKYADVQALAKMVPALSSHSPVVVSLEPAVTSDDRSYGVQAPPITSDPPDHTWARRLILPYFSPHAVEKHQPFTEKLCHDLIDRFIERGTVDGAVEYAQQIPPRVIAHMMGFDENRVDEFVGWVRGVLELGLTNPEIRKENRQLLMDYLFDEVEDRMENPRDDFISFLCHAELDDGSRLPLKHIVGTCNLMMVAGIDTTWSSIGSALWHLGTHESDRRWLANEPELLPTAIEELLRAYSPVSMGRVVTEEVSYGGADMCPGDRVIMNFPGANHDPEVFENPDEVILDRQKNRHVAFGAGIHRCAGSNLARMEMNIAIGVWMKRLPEFVVSDPESVTWAGGQVRGPRELPISFPT